MVKRKSKYSNDWREVEIQCDGVLSDVIMWLDGGTCQLCGGTFRMGGHHIIRRNEKRVRHDPNNLILLCDKCHREAHNDKDAFLEQLKEKFPRMYEWHEMNRHPDGMQFYRQYLDKVYPELKRIQLRIRVEHEEYKERFRRI